MLIRRRGVSEPGIIGNIHQQTCTPLPVSPARFRQNAFITDHDAQLLLISVFIYQQRIITRATPEITDSRHQLADEREETSQGYIFPVGTR